VLFVDVTAKRGLVNSLVISTIGATIAVIICMLLALFVQRTKLPGRQGVVWLSMLPVTVPGIVLGLGFLIAFVTTPLYGTIWVIMLAYIVHYLPTGLRNMEALVQSVSPELDDSARVLGASWLEAMWRIMVPLLTPGMISLWLLLFVTFIREVSASMMLFTYGTETMSIALIRIMEYEPYGVSGAFSVLQTVLLLACVGFIRHLSTMRQAGCAASVASVARMKRSKIRDADQRWLRRISLCFMPATGSEGAAGSCVTSKEVASPSLGLLGSTFGRGPACRRRPTLPPCRAPRSPAF
jgi:iron(III) transport system permease protein